MKVIIITGASRGLGKSLFDMLQDHKDSFVIGVSRTFSKKQLENAESRKDNLLLRIDLSHLEGINQLLTVITNLPKEKASSFCFINNAGTVRPIGAVGTLSQTELLNAIHVNNTAPIIITNHLLAFNKKTIILNISSGAATRPIAGWAIYCATKAAVKMFFDVLEEENQAVEIHQINPGVMDTDMQADIRNATVSDFPDIKKFRKFKEDNQLKSPEEVAASILASIEL